MPENKMNTALARRGFTLVELMVVMLIIALLASILVPSVNNARIAAKTASSKSLIFVLESAVNMFRSDDTLGNDYPPSTWPPGGGVQVEAEDDPYDTGGGYYVWGAQTLVWAVVGARLTGTYPFEEDRLCDDYNSRQNARGPFVDPSKLEIVRPHDPRCAIEDTLPGQAEDAAGPVILDSFGVPVLYYKPDRSTTSSDPIPVRLPQTDNFGFTGMGGLQPLHSDLHEPGVYEDHFRDQRAEGLFPGTNRPYNYDSFVLIGAGADRIYGTADDTENFKRPN